MKVFPCSVEILIFISSLKTFVPIVTDDLSPPASLRTGADSPVMADSSILATPSIISPSPGIISPTLHTTISPIFRLVELTYSISLFTSFLALVSAFAFFKESVLAFPCPSAIASEKFAKITVAHNHKAICQGQARCVPVLQGARPLDALLVGR